MKVRHLIALIILLFVFIGGQLWAEEIVGTSVFPNIETPHPYPMAENGSTLVWSTTIHEPGANWIKVHFSNFQLNREDYVEIVDANGKSIERISGKIITHPDSVWFKVSLGDNNSVNFWGPTVVGVKVIINLHRNSKKENATGFTIDEVGVGCKTNFPDIRGPIFEDFDVDFETGVINRPIESMGQPGGIMLFKKGNIWYSSKGYLMAKSGNYFKPNTPCLDAHVAADSIEVRFYNSFIQKTKNFNYYYAYCGNDIIFESLRLNSGIVDLDGGVHLAVFPIYNGHSPQDLDLTNLYRVSYTYYHCIYSYYCNNCGESYYRTCCCNDCDSCNTPSADCPSCNKSGTLCEQRCYSGSNDC